MTDNILDYGFVRLVSHMGNDASIVSAARVSFGPGTKTIREDAGLIRYLYQHQHMTPFEHVTFTFHAKCPIFVARQWFRHRTGSFNEISGRYSVLDDQAYIPDPIRVQHSNRKQGSAEPLEEPHQTCARELMEMAVERSYFAYRSMLAMGVAREQARMILPLNAYTSFYWTVNLRNLMQFLSLRRDENAQYEIRVYADAMADIVREIVPLAWEAYEAR